MLFAVLEIEDKVQLNDKTRLSAVKSYKTPDALSIVGAEVTPGATGSAVVLNPLGSPTPAQVAQEYWFTDWQWESYAFDVDSYSNKIDFQIAGTLYVATVASATYASHELLRAAIETALNAAGSPATFTVTLDELNKLTIASTFSFSLLPYTGVNRLNGLLSHVGFSGNDTDFSVDHTGLPIEYGLRKITLEIEDSATPTPNTASQVLYQKVYTELGDNLLSSDFDLQKHEDDILKWVPDGRSSFKDIHRRVQDLILEHLAGDGYLTSDREKFTKWDLVVKKDLRDWATYFALYLIFEGNSNAVDDVFSQKAKRYEASMIRARQRYISVDIDADGKADSDENLRLSTINIFQR